MQPPLQRGCRAQQQLDEGFGLVDVARPVAEDLLELVDDDGARFVLELRLQGGVQLRERQLACEVVSGSGMTYCIEMHLRIPRHIGVILRGLANYVVASRII
jgi:hypothetical protein